MSKPSSAIIVAMDRHHLIGDHGRLPWNIPEDLRLFRQLTEGNTVVMGRGTFESLGSPLANRHNLVLSRSLYERDDIKVCHTFSQALAEAWRIARPVFFIGGQTVYRKALPIVDQLHISWVDGEFKGALYFPEIAFDAWQITEEKIYRGFRYNRYRRRKVSGQDEG
jgi:dihydrofolate reductase